MAASSMALQNLWDAPGVGGGYGGWSYNRTNNNSFAPSLGASYGSGGVAPQSGGSNQYSYSASASSPADRYDEILQGYKDRYARNIGGLDALGATQQKSIAEQYGNRAADATQQLTGRGLSGTTVYDTTKTGIANEQAAASADAMAKLQAQKAQLDAGLSKDQLDFQERYRPTQAQASGSGSGSGSGGGGPLNGGYSQAQGLANMQSLLPRVVGGGYESANMQGKLTSQQMDQMRRGVVPKNSFQGQGALNTAAQKAGIWS